MQRRVGVRARGGESAGSRADAILSVDVCSRSCQCGSQTSVPPHPSGMLPVKPAGHVAGVQHVPSCEPLVTHSDPGAHCTHVMSGRPHPWGTGRHDLNDSELQVTGVQHVWSPACPLHTWFEPHGVVQVIEFPVHGSVYVPQ